MQAGKKEEEGEEKGHAKRAMHFLHHKPVARTAKLVWVPGDAQLRAWGAAVPCVPAAWGWGLCLEGGGKLLQGGDGGTGVAVRLGGGDLSGVPSASGGQLQFCSGGSTEGPPPSLRICIDNIPRAQRCLSQFKPKPD